MPEPEDHPRVGVSVVTGTWAMVKPTEPGSGWGGIGMTLVGAAPRSVRVGVGIGAGTGPMMTGARVDTRADVGIEDERVCTSS